MPAAPPHTAQKMEIQRNSPDGSRNFIFLPNALDQTFRAVAHKAAPPRL
jgi:hypothetical protein